jgi:tRNA pseudouridine38-40 synthase
MPRYALQLAYNGASFSGFQEQPQRETIQSVLEKSLKTVLSESMRVIPSGRTDSGVHALNQVVHFDLKTEKAIERIEENRFLFKINGVLPDAISVRSAKKVSERFHARKSAKSKTYVYMILVSRMKNPHLADKVWRLPRELNLKAMKKAATYLVGEYDFTAFCAADSTVTHKIRRVTSIVLSTQNPFGFLALKGDHFIVVTVTGEGFLKQMVRNMVGTLVVIGQDKVLPEKVKALLESCDRKKAFAPAPAQGLYLKKVAYK